MATKYRLLVFDWDGTLMDSTAKIIACLQRAILAVAMPERSPEQLRHVIGLGLREAFDTLYPDVEYGHIQQLITAYKMQYLHLDNTPASLFSGVDAMLETLHNQGYRLTIATGKGRNGLNKILQETGLTSRFEMTCCAEETASKPQPHMLYELMRETGVIADHMLMVGDTAFDLEMAKRAGVDAVAVKHGAHRPEQLIAWSPLTLLDHITDLVLWLDQHQLKSVQQSNNEVQIG